MILDNTLKSIMRNYFGKLWTTAEQKKKIGLTHLKESINFFSLVCLRPPHFLQFIVIIFNQRGFFC